MVMSPVRPVIASQASGRNPARYSIGHSAPYSVADGSPECHCSTELIPSYPFFQTSYPNSLSCVFTCTWSTVHKIDRFG